VVDLVEALNGKKIFIAVPTRGQIHISLAQWLGDTTRQSYKGYEFVIQFRSQDPTDCNRNELVKMFLDGPNNEWLLFLDDDMAPYSNILSMIDRGEKVVSGLTCVFQRNNPNPLVMRYANSEGTLYRMVSLDELGEAGSLIEVDGVGTGCLLVHREVLERLKAPWFLFERNPEGMLARSEDYYFSRRCKDLGYRLFVDPDAIVGHFKWMDLMQINALLFKAKSDSKMKVEDMTSKGTANSVLSHIEKSLF
jgi:hypothetical protein